MARPSNAAARGEPGAPGAAGARAPDPVVAGGVAIGSGTFTLIARAPGVGADAGGAGVGAGGPSGGAGGAGELLEAARLARQARAGLLDVGRAWETLGAEAIEACRRGSGLTPICAVSEPGDLGGATEVAGMLRVPASALAGSLLARALGRAGLPVLLVRDQGASVQAWLRAAERLEQEGNPEVVLCDPGADLAAVPSLRAAGRRPLVVDAGDPAGRAPAGGSGAMGGSAAALARAAAAVGADGVSIAVDDGLDGLSSELDAVAAAVGRRMAGRRIRYVDGRRWQPQ
jgi:3-deoxy-7-phosphoheptulonate synthase